MIGFRMGANPMQPKRAISAFTLRGHALADETEFAERCL
jgi:hypothetical protein